MAIALYEPTDTTGQPLNTVYAEDTRQIVRALLGTNDPGALTLSVSISAPSSAPAATLAAGSVTSTGRTWAAYWITGTIDGTGAHYINGRTTLGPATSSTALSSQEATLTAPGSPPAQAIGWGVAATQQGETTTFYTVAEAFLTEYAGAWPQIVDNTPDASLTTAAPSTNTTGTTLAGILSLLSGSSITGTISGNPTLSGNVTLTNPVVVGGIVSNDAGGAGLDIEVDGTYDVWIYRAGGGLQFQQSTRSLFVANGKVSANTLASTVPTGTAPLSVASTTVVPNLNAAQVNGKTLGDGTREFTVAQIMAWSQVTNGTASNYNQANYVLNSSTTPLLVGSLSEPYGMTALVQQASASNEYYFEAALSTNTSGDTAYAELWDVTSNAAVSGSTVSTTTVMGSGFAIVRSAAVSITAGHVYGTKIWSSSTGGAVIGSARIVGVF